MASHRWLVVLGLGLLVAGCLGSPAAQEQPSFESRAAAAEHGLDGVQANHTRLRAELDDVGSGAQEVAADLLRIQQELSGIAEAAAALQAQEEPAAEPSAV